MIVTKIQQAADRCYAEYHMLGVELPRTDSFVRQAMEHARVQFEADLRRALRVHPET